MKKSKAPQLRRWRHLLGSSRDSYVMHFELRVFRFGQYLLDLQDSFIEIQSSSKAFWNQSINH